MPITQALKEIYASAPATQRYVETLTFSHSLFPRTYYLTNDVLPWSFLLETGQLVTFQQVPFKIVLPASDGKGNQDLGLTIANIGRELVDALEAAIANPAEAITCVWRVYLDQASSAPQNSPPLVLKITGAAMDRDAVSATATRADILNRAFPFNFYKTSEFPGLRR